jgi:hypothetical protein
MIDVQKQLEDTQGEKARLQAKLDATEKQFNDAIADVKKSATNDRDKDRTEILALSKSLNAENVEKNKNKAALAATEAQKAELTATLKQKESKLAEETKDKNQATAQVSDLKNQVAELEKRLPEKDKTLADRALDAEAVKELANWHKDKAKMRWKITYLDQKGDKPYINLGSADGLETGTTFSLHDLGRNGQLEQIPKGSVEVIQIVGPHVARVRVTSVTDRNKNPIVVGDQLFNPTWGPGIPKRIAIAGLADLGGEGTEDAEDLRRLLKRQNVVVDAYVATKNRKAPDLLNERGDKGDLTSKTSFLIIADGLEALGNHPKRNDKEFTKAFEDQVNALRAKAQANGVPVISLPRYLDMIGYRASKASGTQTSRYGSGR